MTVAAIIQARMGSTRLPGKTLARLGDRTVLDWTVERASLADGVDDVIVATSSNREDDEIARQLEQRGVRYVRGSADDVLGRYAAALESTEADHIVRLTADCPLVDPSVITRSIDTLAAVTDDADATDYVSTSLDGRYPRGLDVEAVRREVLAAAAAEATVRDEREHVTLFIYRRPDRFVCRPVPAPTPLQRPDLRFTVDEQADLDVVRGVVEGLAATPATLTAESVVGFLDEHPEIAGLNRAVRHRHVQ